MPKLKQSPNDKMDNSFRAAIASGMELSSVDAKSLASRLGIGESTLRRHRRNPSQCSLDELRSLCRLLSITPRQLCDICGVKYQ